MSATAARVPVSVRIPADALDTIDAEAHRLGLSRTDYLIRAGTRTLPEHQNDAERRLTTLEDQVARLQALAYG